MEKRQLVENIFKCLYSQVKVCEKEYYEIIAEYVFDKLGKHFSALSDNKEIIIGEDFMKFLSHDEQMKIFIRMNK